MWKITACYTLKFTRCERKNIGHSENEIKNTSCHLIFSSILQMITRVDFIIFIEKKSIRGTSCPPSGQRAAVRKARCTQRSLRWLADGFRRARRWGLPRTSGRIKRALWNLWSRIMRLFRFCLFHCHALWTSYVITFLLAFYPSLFTQYTVIYFQVRIIMRFKEKCDPTSWIIVPVIMYNHDNANLVHVFSCQLV